MKNDLCFAAHVPGTVWYQTLPLNPPATRCKTVTSAQITHGNNDAINNKNHMTLTPCPHLRGNLPDYQPSTITYQLLCPEPRERNQPSTRPCGVSNVRSFSAPSPKSDRLNLNNQPPINDLRTKSGSNVTSASFLFMGHYGTFETTSGAAATLNVRFFSSPKNLS
jgi:hypothetical protein